MSTKRPRTVGDDDDDSSQTITEPQNSLSADQAAAKVARITSSATSQRPLLCTLPPTCNPPHNKPTRLANSAALEAHYATYHAHVCEEKGCGAVFPDERLLELHQTECHDPIAAVRKDKGEKIFACLVSTCTRLFQTPKARRLHLIQTHAYPKEYFFAVTNKGVGGLLKRWGEGASLVRQEWKPRSKMDVDAGDSEGSDEGSDLEEDTEKRIQAEEGERELSRHEVRTEQDIQLHEVEDASVDALASSMGTLSLVPPTIRFGRGARNAVAGTTHPGRGARGVPATARGRGDVVRGRGTGRGRGSDTGAGAGAGHTTGPVSRGRARIAIHANPRGRGGQARGGGHSRTSTLDSEISLDTIPPPNQSAEESVSINIDAALEALRGESIGVVAGQTGRGRGRGTGSGGRRFGPRGRGRT